MLIVALYSHHETALRARYSNFHRVEDHAIGLKECHSYEVAGPVWRLPCLDIENSYTTLRAANWTTYSKLML
ncbi:hypothetical protein ATC00_28385 [Sinorhizobium americanum]|nr:hypothetical protein ATC00_28385 [Sinorhizobium americanum]